MLNRVWASTRIDGASDRALTGWFGADAVGEHLELTVVVVGHDAAVDVLACCSPPERMGAERNSGQLRHLFDLLT
jgi:hypothetical protein